MARNKFRLSHQHLTRRLPSSWAKFTTTAELKGYRGMIGQARAMQAIEVGLKIPTRGFNIFALGDPGSGKTSTLSRLLEERAAKEPVPSDLCYVANFRHPDQPRPLLLPPGRGTALAKEMERVVRELTRLIPRVLSEGAFGHIRSGILADARAKEEQLNRRTADVAEKLGVLIQEDEGELQVIPLYKGEPIDHETFLGLSAARRRRIEQNMLAFQEHVERNAYGRRQLERRTHERLLGAEVSAIKPVVEQLLGEVAWDFRGHSGVAAYLEDAERHILENHRDFLPVTEEGEEEAGEQEDLSKHRAFQVNVVVDRSDDKGAPVVTERVPSTDNLAGYFEYRSANGGLATDHCLIRPGALHKANGGYLLLQASDLLSQENAWDCLKGALRHKEVRIEKGIGTGGEGQPRIAGAMKPETVPLDVKVILVGGSEFYYLLKLEDEDFSRLFKIKAEFESTMPRNRRNVARLARFLGQVCREEGHLALHRSGFARILEVASRLAEHKERLSTHRARLLDLLAEANFYARQGRARAIRARDVDRAIVEQRRRHDATAAEVAREIREGTIIIRTNGHAVGQLNGIALYDLAGVTFGIPVRITARIYAGQRGVVNIDREVQLSGAIHDKGAMILVGFLGGRFAQAHTLGLSASITFEQSYDEIDGDSASSAELYALLSALSGCPIHQGIAVTGSVNQLGEVQPIGGVNEKIEGIFRVCQSRKLTGKQGVMIPRANVKNLMLSREVVDAARSGKFNIFAISTVDEGIEVLTGIKAGTQRQDGSWTPGSINDRVQRRLHALQAVVRDAGTKTHLDRDL